MSMAGRFLGGAQDRLLPAAIPFRFFVTAAVFHLLAWMVLLLAADEVAGFRGGTGPVLAAIHLLTLGTLAMTAIGASLQLFPVVTRRALTRNWPGHFSYALMLPGVALLSWGMALHQTTAMQLGAGLTCYGLLVFVALTANNLRRASSIPVVAAHGWLALATLFVAALLGVLMIWGIELNILSNRSGLAITHLTLASYGFMGSLVLGLSLVLIPMFVLSRSLPPNPGWAQLGLTALALLVFSISFVSEFPGLIWLALIAGFGGTGFYLWQMAKILRSSMRKRLGLPFVLIRASWGFLILTLLLVTAYLAGLAIPNAVSLIGFVLLAGWLLTFLCGVLHRIMPFLASMHAAGKSGLPPLLSDLTAEGPLMLHAVCHFSAVTLCGIGIVADQSLLIRIGSALGVVGAAGFATFAIIVALKVRQGPRTS